MRVFFAIAFVSALAACAHADERELASPTSPAAAAIPSQTPEIVVAPLPPRDSSSCPEGSRYIEDRGCVADAPPLDDARARGSTMQASPDHLDPCGAWDAPKSGVNDCDPDEEGGPDVGFARGKALRTLFDAKLDLAKCKKPGGPSGAGKIEITYASDGGARAARAIGEPYAGSAVGQCVADHYKKIKVPAFKQRELVVVAHFELK